MSQQNSNIQPSINISNQQITQNATSSNVGIQSSKNMQILNSINSNINLNQTSGITYTMDNNNIKPTSLKINQMTGSTLTLLPTINSIPNSNTTQSATSISNNVSSSGSQTSTNSSGSSSSTSTYGGFGKF